MRETWTLRPEDNAIRPREVDVLEDALAGLFSGERTHRTEPVLIDDHELPGLDLPDIRRVDQVQGTGLGAQNVAIAELSENERAESSRIANAVKSVLGEEEQGEGSFQRT